MNETSEEHSLELQQFRKQLDRLLDPNHYSPEQPYHLICLTLEELWHYTDPYETKHIFLEQKYQLLPLFQNLLQRFQSQGTFHEPDKDLELQVLRCIWYLSRATENRKPLAAKEYGLLPLLMERIHLPRYTPIVLNILLNCSLESYNHVGLVSHELGYLSYLSEQLRVTSPFHVDLYRAINYLSLGIDNHGALMLHYYHIPRRIHQVLLTFGPYPHRWPNRFDGTEYWCLNTLMDLSTVPNGAWVLREIQAEYFLHDILSRFKFMLKAEELKVFISLLNIWFTCDYSRSEHQLSNHCSTSFESSASTTSTVTTTMRLFQYQVKSEQNYGDDLSLFRFLLCVLQATMEYPADPENQLYARLLRRGWAFGIIMMRTVVSAIYHFLCLEAAFSRLPGQPRGSLHHQYIQLLLLNESFLSHEIQLLELYTQGGESIRIFDEVGYISAGGGRDDPDVAIMILRTLFLLFTAISPPNETERVIDRLMREGVMNVEILLRLKRCLGQLLESHDPHTKKASTVMGEPLSQRKIPLEIIYLARAVNTELDTILSA